MESRGYNSSDKKKTVNVGCGCMGCVTPFIAIILIICCLDILGCEKCKGFTHRALERITSGK